MPVQSTIATLPAQRTSKTTTLSIIVPVYNEDDVLEEFHERLGATLACLGLSSEIIYVNDGSSDRSIDLMRQLHRTDDRVALINLSRNFGKEVAVTAGLDHASGEAVVVIDADLQDPPEVIPLLIAKWREGYDMVYATRRARYGETWLKRATANLFYRLIHNVGDIPIPKNTGDFRLLNRRCVDALARCRERRRFMKGLFAWVGFKHASVEYDRDPRFSGETKWNYWRLWNFALEGITSCTIVPLKLATYLGLGTAFTAMIYAAYIFSRTLFLGREVAGYASLMVTMLFVAGVQLIAIGIIGEYVGRIFVESKGRPLYLLDDYVPARGVPVTLELE
jgi:glycosyltransferase involved in cell wall biosynthesis